MTILVIARPTLSFRWSRFTRLGLPVRSAVRRLLHIFVLIPNNILNDQRNTPVRRLERVPGDTQFLIGVASDLRDLVLM